MERKCGLTQNYLVDSVTVSDMGTQICNVMANANEILEEASGILGEVSSLVSCVPQEARCGELLDACAMAQAEINAVDYMAYGQRTRNSMVELADYSEYISTQFVKKMESNTERVQNFSLGCKSLSMLLKYSKGNLDSCVQLTGVQQLRVSRAEGEVVSYTKLSVSQQAAEMSGIQVNSSGVPIINNGSDAKRYMSCLNCVMTKKTEFVGYLSYGADGIEQNSDSGFFRLYNAPTLNSEGKQYFFADLYDYYDVEPYGALQSFGGEGSTLNSSNGTNYGGQKLDTSKGTLIYNGMERYAIAIGPTLQNPDWSLDDNGNIDPDYMRYGTCVDISVEVEGETYYIPAIIVDVKANSAPTGVFQSGETFSGIYVNTGKEGTIVEWYVQQGGEECDKSTGLAQFNRNGSIIIYKDEVLK